jgi:hypothetical protein
MQNVKQTTPFLSIRNPKQVKMADFLVANLTFFRILFKFHGGFWSTDECSKRNRLSLFKFHGKSQFSNLLKIKFALK